LIQTRNSCLLHILENVALQDKFLQHCRTQECIYTQLQVKVTTDMLSLLQPISAHYALIIYILSLSHLKLVNKKERISTYEFQIKDKFLVYGNKRMQNNLKIWTLNPLKSSNA